MDANKRKRYEKVSIELTKLSGAGKISRECPVV